MVIPESKKKQWESEWMTGVDPRWMIHVLTDMASPRKLRLFIVGCCRLVWRHMKDDRLREAVRRAEAFAESGIPYSALEKTRERLYALYVNYLGNGKQTAIRHDCWAACLGDAYMATLHVVGAPEPVPYLNQAKILRDIFGNLFKPLSARHPSGLVVANHTPVEGSVETVLTPEMLAWNDGTLGKLAHKMYQSRKFKGMPVLADALEEAGCTNEEVLNHCRKEKYHTRGCWVCDLILGKS